MPFGVSGKAIGTGNDIRGALEKFILFQFRAIGPRATTADQPATVSFNGGRLVVRRLRKQLRQRVAVVRGSRSRERRRYGRA